MADRAQPVRPGAGIVAATLVAVTILGSLAAVFWRAGGAVSPGPADWSAVRFTILQALVSAGLSLVLAIPVARALARRRFPGRGLLVTLLGAPFLLPVIVAILGLLAVFGRSGWVNGALGAFGLPPIQIYGFHGVVLAHVFFNLPLATRLILQGWAEIPAERFRLAAQLNLGPGDIRRLLEWPMLARIAPGAFAVVFGICLTSFAVALTLGGGPRATTVELAIYQAFQFDFDLGRAAFLACIQIALTLSAALIALRLATGESFGAGLDRIVDRWDADAPGLRLTDTACIMFAALFLVVPMAAVAVNGLPGMLSLPASVWRAVAASLKVALLSLAVLSALAIPMTAALSLGRHRWIDLAGLLGLAVSPLALGTGLFIVLYPLADPAALALPVTAGVNAVMALPFAMRILVPAARTIVQDHGRLGAHLDMGRGPFLRLVLLPRLAPQLGFAAGLGMALSLGDLGVIALFANNDAATLPLQIYRLMGAYRMQAASGAALLLMLLAFGAFWICDHKGRARAET
ncbi:MAG: thiamine/thiamine pyrophosphate ABC transporter permease ThiP [Rhodobacteraceae bacterium]|nr:thiamine/thiamine pyrophosphate ABC transporter permease ThiP [Paracoccaceae bacterium]MAY46136.1 thiamine/thiamine pyrophosphate ABC transporter permease ThiP [Paracoccaceae bacterium]